MDRDRERARHLQRINGALGGLAVLVLGVVLTGCGGSAGGTAAPALPTATASATSGGPAATATATATTGATATPAPTATPTPLPLRSQERTVPLTLGAAGTLLVSGARSRAVVLTGAANAPAQHLAVVDTNRGAIVATLAVTVPTASGKTPLLVLDEARDRAYLAIPGDFATDPTLTAIDLATGRHVATWTLHGHPDADLGGLAVDAARGTIDVQADGTTGDGVSASRAVSTTILALSPAGRALRRLALPYDDTHPAPQNLIVDGRHDRALLIVPDPLGATTRTAQLVGLDAGRLRRVWRRPLAYVPSQVRLDERRGWLWLLAPGGRATVVSVVDGSPVGVVPLTDARPTDWTQDPDLTIDPATGTGDVSWCGGAASDPVLCHVDRLDPSTGTRATTPAAGAAVLAIAPTRGLYVTMEPNAASHLVARRLRDGQALATVADLTALSGGAGVTLAALAATPAGSPIATADTGRAALLGLAMTVSAPNDVSGAQTTDGVVLLTLIPTGAGGVAR